MLKVQYALDFSPAEQLARNGLRKAIRIAVNRASGPVKMSVVNHAEAIRRYGFLAKSIRIKVKIYPSDRVVSIVGPASAYERTKGKFKRGKRKGQARKFRPSKVAHLVEAGTKRTRKRPWLKPAHTEAAPRFLARVEIELGKEISAELARGGAR